MNKTDTKKRRFDEQFKRDAVALLEGGRKVAQLARDLNVSHWNLRNWKRLYGTGAAIESRPPARSARLASAGGSSAVAAAVELASMRRELDAVRAQKRHFKKSLGHSSPARTQRYALIQPLHHEQPRMNLSLACKALGVSRSGYHAHLGKPRRSRRLCDAVLATEIRAAFTASRRTYGSPRLMHCLRHKGLTHGKNRIARIMREQHLCVLQKRRFVPRTILTDMASPVAPNLLLKRPAPKRPDEVWVTDITYLPTREGWLYLAAEMDLCSRRILGWSTLDTLATELPSQALYRALQTRGSRPGQLLHHSDRGCQYTSAEFRRSLQLRGITQSMSRRANCYDNATMESFWATLKAECFGSAVPATRSQARSMIFDYIETFYNPVRLHSALGFLSPMDFEHSIQNN